MAPTIFFILSGYVFFKNFIKNPQTTIALTFLTHIDSDIGGVIIIFLHFFLYFYQLYNHEVRGLKFLIL